MTRATCLKTQDIPISSITLSTEWASRTVEPANVDELATSIKEVGILQPIVVRASGELFELVAGRHRLGAAKLAGFTTIPASIIETDDVATEMASLVENLHRYELTDEEWDTAVARWKELYEAAHAVPPPQGGRPKKSKTGRTPTSFVKHAATKTGKGATSIKQAVLRATKLAPEARLAYRTGRVSKGQADELVKLPAEKQKRVLQLVAGKSVEETREVVKTEREGTVEEAPKNDLELLVLRMSEFVAEGERLGEKLDKEQEAIDARGKELVTLAEAAGLPKKKQVRGFVECVEALARVLGTAEAARAERCRGLVGALMAGVEGFDGAVASRGGYERGAYESRPQRWNAACGHAVAALKELVALQGEYKEWGEYLSDDLRGGPVEDQIKKVIALHFEDVLEAVVQAGAVPLPRAFGRD
jgi:ParB family transcriptional regulator, chromosome partitioning protein